MAGIINIGLTHNSDPCGIDSLMASRGTRATTRGTVDPLAGLSAGPARLPMYIEATARLILSIGARRGSSTT